MKRILQVMSSLHGNGTETAIMNIYRTLDREKYQFDFLVFDDEEMDFYDEIKSLGGEIHIVPNRRKSLWGYLRDTWRFFRRNAGRYDAVHLNFCYLSVLWPFLMAKVSGIPRRIMHSHSSNYVGSKVNLYLHRLFRRADIALCTDYVACSPEARDWFYKGTKAMDSCHVVPNGIRLDTFSFNPAIRDQYRRELGLGDAPVLGQIGYFSPVKNHRFSIELMKKLREHVPGVKLLFVGKGGDNEQEIFELVQREGLDTNIVFLGYRRDVGKIFQAMDMLIHPSLFEGLPLTLVEAQAAGLKVVASSTVSKESRFTDNITFLPIDQGVDVWVDTIVKQLGYERKNIKDEVDSCIFDIKNNTDRILTLYSTK